MKRLILAVVFFCMVTALAITAPAHASGSAWKIGAFGINELGKAWQAAQPTAKDLGILESFTLRMEGAGLAEMNQSVRDYAMYAIKHGRSLPTLNQLKGLVSIARKDLTLATYMLRSVLIGMPLTWGKNLAVKAWANREGIVVGAVIVGGVTVNVLVKKGIDKAVAYWQKATHEVGLAWEAHADRVLRGEWPYKSR